MAQKILTYCKCHKALLAMIVLGLWFAYGNAFMQDDAYISYNYAKWFSRGQGLVWYPGSTEFGYTNFLYTFTIGVAMLFGIQPEMASNVINIASFIGCLVLVFHIGERCLGKKWALLPVLLLATDHTFTAYATGGLETMWVTFLILLFYWHILTFENHQPSTIYLRLGSIAAVALLTRLDTALLLAPGYVFLLVTHASCVNKSGMLAQCWRMRESILIPLLTTIGFLIACEFAYGHMLPNSFYIKIPNSDSMIQLGLHYLVLYNSLHMYMPFLIPALFLYFFIKRDNLRNAGSFTLLMAATVLVWLIYIVYVGGDFMEFRFIVPVLGLYYLVIMKIVWELVPSRRQLWVAVIGFGFLVANGLHPMLFKTQAGNYDLPNRPKPIEYAYVETTESLNDWLHYPRVNWRLIGAGLYTLFNGTDVYVAANAVGAIAYYSDLSVFDLLGLNQREVLNDYEPFLHRSGHTIKASDKLIVRSRVNLNLSHPQTLCKLGRKFVQTPNIPKKFEYAQHETLLLPIGDSCYLVADYVTPHPTIDQMIKNKTILRYKDVAATTDCPSWLCLK